MRLINRILTGIGLAVFAANLFLPNEMIPSLLKLGNRRSSYGSVGKLLQMKRSKR